MGNIIELRPELGELVDETDAIDRIELEADIRLYRSRRRREVAQAAAAKRARWEALVVGGLLALAVGWLGHGAAVVWPS